ncbi:hypothetical protein JOD52_001001 [Brachybacterium muris]|uniref:hypothetical protein n=1 Tax=Brachybacterium muris TaxID=219301 RepID=UPI0019594162|nr:hypothetical protein [Brachybacterium muris]MBM7499204.1 hypothetical protein [Brachybacterium muris]MBM7500161.1 hypothetical protein [Brachybacterium muris]
MPAGASGPHRGGYWPPSARSAVPKSKIRWLPRLRILNRVEAACALALTGRVRSPRYAHLHPILATGQDKVAALRPPREEPAEDGGYVRGADYYAGGVR